ncbi:ORF6N domain-containing protein [Desulfonatronum sp. SC1]|uniref:ORF6N domain-containing protein n=1 Tax=Desulfonatronum sp. SC1 TaxID=2109626 RepID=UPI0018EE6406|nr:ORF6N domain-containing protein [Desulfonatronum sp. SC1]
MKLKTDDQTLPEVAAAMRILVIRGKRVVVDSYLADIYSVTTKRFNEQVKRNKDRFPQDFMFQLTREKKTSWSQNATTSKISNILRIFPMCSQDMGR